MSEKSTAFQHKFMSWMYRGKGIFNPLNTGWIDEHLACVREWVANVFFYRKGDTVIMIDAGYHYDRLEEKMGWLGLKSAQISNVLLTHLDTDHIGAVEADGGYSFLASLAEDNRLAVRALAEFEGKLRARNLRPLVVTGHTGYSADLDFVFAHCDLCCKTSGRRFYNPAAPYDAYDESEDTLARSATPL